MDYRITMHLPAEIGSNSVWENSNKERLTVALLVFLYLAICCLSSVFVTQNYATYHLSYDPARLRSAMIAVATIVPVLVLFFAFAKFGFGYVAGFYFSSMVVGYLWLNNFSDFHYDRTLAELSAMASLVGFLLPVLFISSPIRQIGTMEPRTFDRLLTLLSLVCVATLVIGAAYNFRMVNPGDASNVRGDPFPAILRHLIGITSSSLLPFLFACFLARRYLWRAGMVLLLLFFYYPMALTKTALLTPVWLVFILMLLRLFSAKSAVVLSLLLPTLAGVILVLLAKYQVVPSEIAMTYDFNVNFRMVAVPSLAMDVYNDFFSRHELTYFCQIRVLKPIMSCPYQEQLAVLMQNYYPFGGNFNASLFATEGIASVGLLAAPIPVFAAGLVFALGNRLSAGLPPSFVLLSGAVLPQILLNVPLSTVLLSHGAGILFLLWYITPRRIFEQG